MKQSQIVDNILSNHASYYIISGNIKTTVSDDLPQFFIAQNIFENPSLNKCNIFAKDVLNFNQENFVLDYLSIDWRTLLKLEQENINFSSEIYLGKISYLLDTHAPLNKKN